MNKENLRNAYIESFSLSPEKQPEFFSIVGDIYNMPQFKMQEKFIQHADITRRQHLLSVAYLSYLETRESGLDYVSAARAAMVHDLVYYDWHEKGDGSHRLHGYRHPGFALKNARALFNVTPLEADIILHHMWPLTPMPPKSKEGRIVSECDKYCASMEILIYRSEKFRENFYKEVARVSGENK